MTEAHRGSCFCGSVEVEATGAPVDMGYCHCTSCRHYSGAPLVAFTIWPADAVRVTRGAELIGRFNKTGPSDRHYCTRCGGHLFIDHPHLGVVDIRAAILPTLRFEPKAHLSYAESVLPVRDGLPKYRDFPAAIGGTGELMAE
jgi:hypothetical protein